jgi:hypothetical protein
MEKGRNFGVSLWDINILASVNWESEREREDLFIAFTLEWEIEEEGLDIAGGKLDVGGVGGGRTIVYINGCSVGENGAFLFLGIWSWTLMLRFMGRQKRDVEVRCP